MWSNDSFLSLLNGPSRRGLQHALQGLYIFPLFLPGYSKCRAREEKTGRLLRTTRQEGGEGLEAVRRRSPVELGVKSRFTILFRFQRRPLRRPRRVSDAKKKRGRRASESWREGRAELKKGELDLNDQHRSSPPFPSSPTTRSSHLLDGGTSLRSPRGRTRHQQRSLRFLRRLHGPIRPFRQPPSFSTLFASQGAFQRQHKVTGCRDFSESKFRA